MPDKPLITSAIHYPHARVPDAASMKQALLFWDRYHVIAPARGFMPHHEGELADAWSLVGDVIVPDEGERQAAHDEIIAFLDKHKALSEKFLVSESSHVGDDLYELYPQKFLGKTWRTLERSGLVTSDGQRRERVMTKWGGLVMMSKLADACAGQAFARVTNMAYAYRAIAAELRDDRTLGAARQLDLPAPNYAPVLLGMIDASSIPLPILMRFRAEESDPTLRHALLRELSAFVAQLSAATSRNQVRELERAFEQRMQLDLQRLKDELKTNRIRFGLSSGVLAAMGAGLTAFSAVTDGPLQFGAQLLAAAGGGAAVGRAGAELFGGGLELRQQQRQVMERHPMAYLHTLSRRQR